VFITIPPAYSEDRYGKSGAVAGSAMRRHNSQHGIATRPIRRFLRNRVRIPAALPSPPPRTLSWGRSWIGVVGRIGGDDMVPWPLKGTTPSEARGAGAHTVRPAFIPPPEQRRLGSRGLRNVSD